MRFPKLPYLLVYGIVIVLAALVSVTGFHLVPSARAQGQQQPPPPRSSKLNVLLIVVDDLNTALGSYGNSVVKTPNIDRLAQRGVQFNRAYCQYGLCNPSRTSFLSGRRPDTTRIFRNTTHPRTYLGDVVFLPEYFQARGYFTARVGKVAHGAFEDAVQWDVSENAVIGKPYLPYTLGKPMAGGELAWAATDNSDDKEQDGKTARRIVQLLEQKRDKPFFITAGFKKPHLPFVAPRKYFDLYPPDQIRLPGEMGEPADDTNDIPPVTLNKPGDWQGQMTDAERRQAIAAYYACVSFIDAQTGVILDAVDRLGLAGNTVVLFMSDHGFHLSEHGGLWQKQTLFEEVARVPLIVAAPGKRVGAVASQPVELLDLYPTLAQLCNLPAPPGQHGKSFLPLLKDTDCPWPEGAFTQNLRGGVMGRAVNNERYRYTEWGNDQIAELYDHVTDPREYTNLANDPASKRTISEMRQLLRQIWP